MCVAGIVSNDGQHPPSSGRHEEYLSTGPMCRYAEDLIPMLTIMAGANADKYRHINIFWCDH